jgi:hypothetical protein
MVSKPEKNSPGEAGKTPDKLTTFSVEIPLMDCDIVEEMRWLDGRVSRVVRHERAQYPT